MVRYSVAVCNYNMADTLDRALRSVLDQVDDRFEVVVVDDGSEDDSVSILSDLAAEYPNLRYVALEPDEERRLNATRQRAVEESEGEYVLVQLDTDDVYDDAITDFVTVYHLLEEATGERFYLKGNSINMAPRDLLLEVPHRNIGYSGDQDLWRRLLAEDAIYFLEHESFCTPIGYERSTWGKLRTLGYEMTREKLRSGISFPSLLRYKLGRLGDRLAVAQLLVAPVAYLDAVRQGRLELPDSVSRFSVLPETRASETRPLSYYEDEYGFSAREELSETGKRIFYDEH